MDTRYGSLYWKSILPVYSPFPMISYFLSNLGDNQFNQERCETKRSVLTDLFRFQIADQDQRIT
jgi:hypothetical protein